MALKDHDKHFTGVQQAPTLPHEQVPNTVSRHAKVPERAIHSVVAESGKPVLDSELNLNQDASWFENYLLRRWQIPSGWLRGRTHNDAYCDYTLGTSPTVTDDSADTDGDGGAFAVGPALIHVDDTLLNAFLLPKLEAVVAGHPIVVEYTNTNTQGFNIIDLGVPTIYDGTPNTVKRCDFVFLEVWRSLVAPSPRASGQVQVVDSSTLANGDQIVINAVLLTAVAAAPAVDEFILVSGNEIQTALNISTAINATANSFDLMVESRVTGDTVTIYSLTKGVGDVAAIPPTGNFVTLAVNFAGGGAGGSWVASAPTLTGGVDRPNKPASEQCKVYRHGNRKSPLGVWLDDEMVDPAIDVESSQRIQIQYRIRSTGFTEGVNYKDHPDGFSTLIGGGPVTPAVFAQGGRELAVHSGNGVDAQDYPFVKADGAEVWLDSSAVGYGIVDDGLWVAGSGNTLSAQDLGAIDGFVFAIPLCFVHRHNNVSDSMAGFKGFDPENNTNGAPAYDHAGYNGPLGVVPAGVSDRVDGHFADVVTQENLLDLRRHVVFPGVDLKAELQYQMQSLMDGNLRTWSVDTESKQTLGSGSGDVSTRMLICNEIGRSNAAQGNAPTSGDTSRGVHIRNFDHVARRFADQPVVERLVMAFYPGDRPDGVTQAPSVAPGTENPGKFVTKMETVAATVSDPNAWFEGDILVFDLRSWVVTTLGKVFQGDDGDGDSMGHVNNSFTDFAPPGTVISDVLGIWHDDGHYTVPVDQAVQAGLIRGLGTTSCEVTLDANGLIINGGDGGNPNHVMVGSDDGATPPAVPVGAALLGSIRRIFVEFEITYPVGVGITDTPDHPVTPDVAMYDGTGALQVAGTPDGGAVIENAAPQRPSDFELLLAPRYRAGFREVQVEYCANDTELHAGGAGGAIGSGATNESIISRTSTTLFFPRRLYSSAAGLQAGLTRVIDVPGGNIVKTLDQPNTEYGASTRLVTLSTSGPAVALTGQQTLCDIEYYAQDPIPNYGALGGGYQINVYYRTNSPQTAGVKEGNMDTAGDGPLPQTLNIEPLLMSDNVWTGQVGMGGHDLAYPYASPLDQIPVNDGNPTDATSQTIHEWYFSASADVAIDDFNANTGLLALRPFVQADVQDVVTLGGAANNQPPRKDGEFRAYYPYADATTYRPTILSQPLYGSTRHKVMVPFLARAIETVEGVSGGVLYRKGELLLIVLTRFAEMDDENNVRFVDEKNRTSAALYRTRNLLLVVGDENTCHVP